MTASISDPEGTGQATTNLLLSVTDALARKTADTYDAKGNVLTVTRLATTPRAT